MSASHFVSHTSLAGELGMLSTFKNAIKNPNYNPSVGVYTSVNDYLQNHHAYKLAQATGQAGPVTLTPNAPPRVFPAHPAPGTDLIHGQTGLPIYPFGVYGNPPRPLPVLPWTIPPCKV